MKTVQQKEGSASMIVYFKTRENTSMPSPPPKVVKWLISDHSPPDITAIFERHRRAEKNRDQLLTARVRKLSETSSDWEEKVERLQSAKNIWLIKLNERSALAEENRRAKLRAMKDRLWKRHSYVAKIRCFDSKPLKSGDLEVVREARFDVINGARDETLKGKVERARQENIKVE